MSEATCGHALVSAADQKRELLARLSQRTITAAKPHPARQHPAGVAWLRRGWRWLLRVAPASEQQLRLALQFTACFLAVMFLQIAAESYTALAGRPVWAVRSAALPAVVDGVTCPLLLELVQMIVVTVLFEASAGSSIKKGLLRLAGTLGGAAVGLAILFFVVLCTGLSHANHPQAWLPVRHSLSACLSSCTRVDTPPSLFSTASRNLFCPLFCWHWHVALLELLRPALPPTPTCRQAWVMQGCTLVFQQVLNSCTLLTADNVLHHRDRRRSGGIHSGCCAVESGQTSHIWRPLFVS